MRRVSLQSRSGRTQGSAARVRSRFGVPWRVAWGGGQRDEQKCDEDKVAYFAILGMIVERMNVRQWKSENVAKGIKETATNH